MTVFLVSTIEKNKEDNEENMDADIRVHRVLDTCI